MATRSTQYVIRVGEQNRAGDGYSFLRWLDPTREHSYGFTGNPSEALRFVGRPAAEVGALTLVKLMADRGHFPTVRLVPARGGVETGFRPEKILGTP